MSGIYSRLDSTPTTILIVVYTLIIILGFLSNMGIGIALATDKVRIGWGQGIGKDRL